MTAKMLKLEARRKMMRERNELGNYKLIRKIERNMRKEEKHNDEVSETNH